jgi:hypothetical protein
MSVIFVTVGWWYLYGKRHTLCHFFTGFFIEMLWLYVGKKWHNVVCVTLCHFLSPTWKKWHYVGRRCVIIFFRHKVRTKMTQSQADIKSFFNTTTDIKSFFKTDLKSESQCQLDIKSFLKTDLKSEKNDLRRPTLCRFKNWHKVRNHFWMTDIKSDKQWHIVGPTLSRFSMIDIKSDKKWHNVGPLKFFLLIISQ